MGFFVLCVSSLTLMVQLSYVFSFPSLFTQAEGRLVAKKFHTHWTDENHVILNEHINCYPYKQLEWTSKIHESPNLVLMGNITFLNTKSLTQPSGWKVKPVCPSFILFLFFFLSSFLIKSKEGKKPIDDLYSEFPNPKYSGVTNHSPLV